LASYCQSVENADMTNPSFPPYPAETAKAYRAAGVWTDDTFVTALDARAKTAPAKTLVQTADGRICSYQEMATRSLRLADAFRGLGLRHGDVIAIQLPSILEFLTAYVAAARAGIILATMHMPYRESELEPLLRFSNAKAVICGPAQGKYEGPEMMRRLVKKIPSLMHIILIGQQNGSSAISFEGLVASGREIPIVDPPPAGAPALLCFTSGTSSNPKGVMQTFETLGANARAYSKTIDLGPDDKSLIAPPFTHIFGLECFHNTLVTGGAVVPLELFTPLAFADLIETAQPTVIYAAPAHLAATLKDGKLQGRDLSSVRQIILGGSICPPQIAADFEAHLPNGRVGQLFGMTEVLLTTQTPMDGPARVRHGTVGRPVPGIDARIVDDEGSAVGKGETGELQMRGFSVMSGYIKNPSANVESFTPDGWFCTGDLSCWDDEGNIIIVGRKKDLINRGGIKINPSDIEAVIMQHESVTNAALVSMPDEVLGERICAFVTLNPNMSLNLKDLCEFLSKQGVAKMRWPERVVVIDEMPMTPTRKVIKRALQAHLQSQSD
jgi:non-ribosomal peptide synthetase component E (peptide arylation enzyme)